MPEYLSPGVYVEEIDTGSKPIEGVSTSTAAMVGVTERGPVNWPMLVTSYGEFTRLFGEYLPAAIFQNSQGAHNYLPHAVEGFFTNGGKRLYVTRALDTAGASAAEFELHDRGSAASTFTLLLRNAPEGSGTLASGNPLYIVNVASLLPGNPLAPNEPIRIDGGSASEYHEVDQVGVAPFVGTHVILDFPLSRSHALPAAGQVESLIRTPIGGALALTADTKRGDTAATVTGAAADIALIVPGSLFEFGGGLQVLEHRIVRTVTSLSGIIARVTLDSALAMDHGMTGTTVTHLDATTVNPATNLDRTANAGDRAVFLTAASAYATGDILVFDRTAPAVIEVRRVGGLAASQVAGGSFGLYPAGSLIEVVTLADDQRTVTAVLAAGPPNARVTVNDATALASGLQLDVDTGATMERMTIQSISGADITFTAPFTMPHVAPFLAVPVRKQLAADAAAGSFVLAVDNRQTLQVHDVVKIDDGPAEEYGIIAAIPNRSPVSPDDGVIVLTAPLTKAHAGKTGTTPGTNVRRQQAPALNNMKPPGVLEFDLTAGATLMIMSEGQAVPPAPAADYAPNDHIRVTTMAGAFYHRLTAVQSLTPQPVTLLNHALTARHAAGSVIWQRNPIIEVQALDAGGWGNRLRLSIEDEPQGLVSRTTLTFNNPPTQIRLASAAGVESGTILELMDSNGDVVNPPLKVDFVDRTSNYLINLAATAGLLPQHLAAIAAAVNPLPVRSREFLLTVRLLHQPDVARPQRNEVVIGSEIFRSLSMDSRHSRYIQKVIGEINGPLRLDDHRPEGESNYIRVHDLAQDLVGPGEPDATLHSVRLGPEALIDLLPTGGTRPARHPLSGGDDSVATMDDGIYIGLDNAQPELRTGLFTFQNVDDISLVACPGRISPAMQGALIDHCELMRYRFAVLDGPSPPDDSLNNVQFQRQQFDTKYAALYYPWMLIPDPFPTNPNNIADFPIPPAGHMQGIYARTDIERGVHKAPANEVVRGILGLQRIINKGEQDILNPYPVNINVIRDFRPNNRGIRVWGGRVITSDSDFKYVNVRRLLIFIEQSIDRGLQWVVFEPNAEPLWARVVRSISNFLTVVWRNGALEGTKREEAYFVKCDRTTMTQTDIDSGRLIVVIGVAPVKPAEFVIVRIGLWTAHSDE